MHLPIVVLTAEAILKPQHLRLLTPVCLGVLAKGWVGGSVGGAGANGYINGYMANGRA